MFSVRSFQTAGFADANFCWRNALATQSSIWRPCPHNPTRETIVEASLIEAANLGDWRRERSKRSARPGLTRTDQSLQAALHDLENLL